VDLPFKVEPSGLKTRDGKDIFVLIYSNGSKRQASVEEAMLYKLLQEKE
jgi:hypothetical protein